jgi:hypothetical protein
MWRTLNGRFIEIYGSNENLRRAKEEIHRLCYKKVKIWLRSDNERNKAKRQFDHKRLIELENTY